MNYKKPVCQKAQIAGCYATKFFIRLGTPCWNVALVAL